MTERPTAAGEPLLTVTESVARVGVSRATFYRIMQDGLLIPAARAGLRGRGRPYFHPDDLDALRERRIVLARKDGAA